MGHFLNSNHVYQARLLGFKKHEGAHSGTRMASTIENVLKHWEICDRIGVTVSDNVTSNDTCLDALFTLLDPSMCREDRLRCAGHIINLVVKAFLHGKDLDAMDIDDIDDLDDDDEVSEQWRRHGSIGKLHNIVRFVRSSPQRRDSFKAVAPEEDDTLPEIDCFATSGTN